MTEAATIEVQVNGRGREIPDGLSIRGLLEWLGLNPALVVVELNREILDRARYDETFAGEKDVIELVHFVGGG